jgi:hypothetical protein
MNRDRYYRRDRILAEPLPWPRIVHLIFRHLDCGKWPIRNEKTWGICEEFYHGLHRILNIFLVAKS